MGSMHKMLEEDGRRSASSNEQPYPDRVVWLIWAVMLLITVLALPFVVRQTAIVNAIANMCMTELSAGR